MTIKLTDDQWADVQREQAPVRVSDPSQQANFVLVRADVYERFKALFEQDPVGEQERRFQLQQWGRRAGWDDSAMDVYDDLDPRRAT
jgi:hypothetical protein